MGTQNRNSTWKKVYVFIIICNVICKIFPRSMVRRWLNRLRFKTSKIAMLKRYCCLKRLGTKFLGKGYVIINSNIVFLSPEKLSLGERISINENSYIDAYGGLEIGDNCLIGHGVSIVAGSHVYGREDIPINMQGIEARPIKIGNNVWIGAKVTICGGATVGNNVVIGANTLVCKNIPDNVVVGGVPAKIIKKLNCLENNV